jgi:hypothetical protein
MPLGKGVHNVLEWMKQETMPLDWRLAEFDLFTVERHGNVRICGYG